LQIVPADVTLAPGQSVKLTAMLYDANGYYLGEAKPQWSLAAMTPPPPAPNAPPAPKDAPAPPAPPVLKGTISENGELSVDKTPGQFGNVVAKISGLTARCRVRVAPRLPYEQDFSKVPVQRTPAGWVNAMGKFAVQELEGKKVLAKLANSASPLVARAHAYIGEPSLTDYTIESDVLSTEAAKKMPDMGVLANRYTLVLDGNKQLARLYSWDAVSHVERNLRFSWKPNVWYRFKLTVTVEGDKALVRGKIWEANSSEPSDWTLALEDPAGNKEGSPALYANVMDTVLAGQKTQVLFANVRVTPNSKGRSR
jgi:hypothetical protein